MWRRPPVVGPQAGIPRGIRCSLLCAVLLAAAPLALRAEEPATWDPSTDQGVPEEQLMETTDGKPPPGSTVSRRPVRKKVVEESAPAAEPVEEAAPEAETTEIAVPTRKRKSAEERRKAQQERSTKKAAEETFEKSEAGSVPGSRSRPVDAGGRRRIQVFLVPVGESAGLAAGAVQAALEGEVARLPGYKPVDLVEELAVPPPPADAEKLGEARRIVADANKLFGQLRYEDAANRYRRALTLMEESGWAATHLDLADGWARLGAALRLAGEDVASKEALQNAVRLDATDTLDGDAIARKLGPILLAAREELEQQPPGVLSIVTSPGGARVFIDGTFRGLSPVSVERLAPGLHHLRVDRPGAYPIVEFVEAKEGNDVPVKLKMRFTPEATELQKTLVQVPRSLDRESGVPDMVKALGRRFALDRAVVGTVEMTRTNEASVRIAIMDFAKDARLIDETKPFVADAETGLDRVVGAWAATVFDRADATRNRSAKDPLSRSDGTEDWYSTEKAREKALKAQKDGEEPDTYRPPETKKQGVTSKDPLDHSDGTEDW